MIAALAHPSRKKKNPRVGRLPGCFHSIQGWGLERQELPALRHAPLGRGARGGRRVLLVYGSRATPGEVIRQGSYGTHAGNNNNPSPWPHPCSHSQSPCWLAAEGGTPHCGVGSARVGLVPGMGVQGRRAEKQRVEVAAKE